MKAPPRRWPVLLFAVTLLLQTAATIGALVFMQLPVSTELDSVEYINTADNVLARGRFSIETGPPYRPNALRTPGPLLLNIPLRVLSFKNDLAAVLISRLVLLLAAWLCVRNAVELGIGGLALLAGPLLILTPTMFYYSMLPYSTELPYSVVCNLLQLGTFLFLNKASRTGGALIGLSAIYALLLRPAALFVLIAYIGSCVIVCFMVHGALRRRVAIAAIVCLVGTCAAYVAWSCRNYVVFRSFQFSTVSADNLLRYNAGRMDPYLDAQGREELRESLKKYPIILGQYHETDQFVVANQESREGLRLILKYPAAFLRSHLGGALESALLFLPGSLGSGRESLFLLLSLAHLGYLLLGGLGLSLALRSLNTAQRAALLIMIVVGTISVLSGGSTHSPRFRIPLDIPLAIGTVNLAVWLGARLPTFQRHRRTTF